MNRIMDEPIFGDLIPTKKMRTRKPLNPQNPSPNEANILAGKENHGSLSQPQSLKQKTKGASKPKQQPKKSLEKELQEMQEKLEQMSLEKEHTQQLLKAREETLKLKEEELEMRGREQEKLQMELNKLHKLQGFKPSLTFPIVQSLREKGQEKKQKKKKGYCEHKRPPPPYVLWCKDQWNETRKLNPNAEFKEISSILGMKWKTVNAEEKKPYEEKYQVEKEAYLKIIGNEKRENEAMRLLEEEQKHKTAMELLEQYLQFKQETENVNKKKTKKEKDPLKPKQPLSAFFVFMKERRAALVAENKNVSEIAKITGEEWKNMTEEMRAPYEEVAKKNKEQYVQEMEVYKQKKDEEALHLLREEDELMKIQKHEALQLLKKKEKTENIIKKTKENRQKRKQKEEKKNADPNRPKRPASSFLLFSKEERKNLLEARPGINNSTLNALISVKWKELSDEKKQIWNGKAAKAMDAYKKELEEYTNKSAAERSNN